MTGALAIAIPLLSLAGAGISFMGQMQAANAASAAGRANQDRANLEAQNRENETRERMARERTENRRRLATLQSRLAGSGLQGSALDVFQESSRRLELRVSDIHRQGANEALSMRDRGNVARWEGESNASGMRSRGFGTLLTGTAGAASSAHRLGLFS